MEQFNELIEDNFFIIDSNNLNTIESKFIGFSIFNGKIYDKDQWDGITVFDGNGTYVQIIKNQENISIYQDFNGSFGIYLFRKDDYFAISNSFMKLLDYVKENHIISLNEDYASHFVSIDLCSLAYRETLINEIEILPKDYILNIDLSSKEITLERIDYGENSVSINSEEGLNLLDTWFDKWINIFRELKSETNNMSLQLSGGFDSRLCLALILSANIDLDHMLIFSIGDEKHTHKEDFLIASQIADHFGFKLNNNVISSERIYFDDIETVIKISFLTKLGIHKQNFYTYSYKLEPVYSITGYGGECIREYWNYSTEIFLNNKKNQAKQVSLNFINPMENIIQNSLNELENERGAKESDLVKLLYNQIRSRNHFGRLSAEFYITNLFKLSPLLDPILHKLKLNDKACEDENLLMAIIFARYCPDLLNFDFNGNRKIDEDTINYAFEINQKYPFKKIDYEFISGPNIKKDGENKYVNKIFGSNSFKKISRLISTNNGNGNDENESSFKKGDAENYVAGIFLSDSFKRIFELNFSHDIYEKILKRMDIIDLFTSERALASIAVIKALNDVNYSKYKYSQSFKEQFNQSLLNYQSFDFNDFSDSFNKYITARIDMKNYGDESNSVEIICTSKKLDLSAYPEWFKDEQGSGLVIESKSNSFDIKIKCIGDGVLNIFLRGIDFRTNEDNRIPIYINFNKFIVNDEIIISEDKIVWHNEPFIHRVNVNNEDVLNLHFEWDKV